MPASRTHHRHARRFGGSFRRIGHLLLCLASCSFTAAMRPAVGEDDTNPTDHTPGDQIGWARFHGDDGHGYAPTASLPDRWTADDYAWTVSLGGEDVGSPIIWNDTVYLTDVGRENPAETTPAGKSLDLVAVDLRSGQIRWRRSHPLADRRRHKRNSAASTTPAADEDHVYMAYGDANGATLSAYSHDGQLAWQRDLGHWEGYHGFAASPMVVDDLVILFNSQQADRLEKDQIGGESLMMAFDRSSGQTRWSTPLKTTRPCYGVPSVYRSPDAARGGQSAQLIAANTGNGMFGLDLQTGDMQWSLDVFNKRCCSTPLVVGNLAIASCGSGGGGNVLSAVRIPNSDDEAAEEVFRLDRNAPYVPTPAVTNGLMFCVADNGIASCIDLNQDGRKLWAERLGGNFGASPVVVGDRVLMVSLNGEATIMRADREAETIASFDLGGSVGATPAVAPDALVLRVGDQLHCLKTTSTQ